MKNKKTCYRHDCAFWNHLEGPNSACDKKHELITEKTEICEDFKEATYRLTPKGCYTLAAIDAHLCEDLENPNLNTSFTLYELRMRRNGYIKDEHTTEKERNATPTVTPQEIFRDSIIDGFDFPEDDDKIQRKITAAFELYVVYMTKAGYFGNEN